MGLGQKPYSTGHTWDGPRVTFRDRTFPPPGPLIGVCDGGSDMSEQLRSAPPYRWQRLRQDWRGIPRKQ